MINEGSVDLDKFLQARCDSLWSKATARDIRQVAGDLQAIQINLMCHQHKNSPTGKNKKTKPMVKQRQSHHKNAQHPVPGQVKRNFDPKLVHKYKDRCPKCSDSAHLEGFQCLAKTFKCKASHMFGHFTSLCYHRNQQKQVPHKSRKPKAHQSKAGALYAQENALAVNQKIPVQKIPFLFKSRYMHPIKYQECSYPCPFDSKPGLSIESISEEEPVLESKIRHLYRHKHHACQHL